MEDCASYATSIKFTTHASRKYVLFGYCLAAQLLSCVAPLTLRVAMLAELALLTLILSKSPRHVARRA